jgi:hypothetical protein
MPGFVVTAVFEVGGGPGGPGGPGRSSREDRSGRDVLATSWGPGHRFSYYDGHTLTLVVEVVGADRAEVSETVLSVAGRRWAELGGRPLPHPSALQLQDVVPQAMVVPGVVGRGPDGLFADSAAGLAARLRATRAALVALDGPPQTRSTRSAIDSTIIDGRKG